VADRIHGLDVLVQQFKLSEEGLKIKQRGRTLLADMKQAHLNWRIRMSNVVQGHEKIEDIATIRNHHVCGLGKWRDSDGKHYDHLPEMGALDRMHEQFHHCVAEAVEAHNTGDFDRANQLMLDVEMLSQQVVEQLEKIEAKIH